MAMMQPLVAGHGTLLFCVMKTSSVAHHSLTNITSSLQHTASGQLRWCCSCHCGIVPQNIKLCTNDNSWSENFDQTPNCTSCRYWGLNDPFLLRTPHQRLPMLFQWARQPLKLPLTLQTVADGHKFSAVRHLSFKQQKCPWRSFSMSPVMVSFDRPHTISY